MLCVISIAPKDEHELFALWEEAKAKSAHIELRLDRFQKIPWEALHLIKPSIITTGPLADADVEKAASLQPDYLDIASNKEHVLFSSVKKKYPDVKLIASYHNYEATDADLDAVYKRLRAFPCDAVKIVTQAHSSLDALRMLSLMQKEGKKFPLIGLCMGEDAAFSRVLAPRYHSPIIYSCLRDSVKTASGQIPYDSFVSTYNIFRVSPSTVPFALIGDPVTNSRSHITHNKIFAYFRLDCVYVKIRIEQDEFQEALHFMSQLGFLGVSVTTPLKYCFQEGIPINTIRLGPSWESCNTDGAAVSDALEHYGNLAQKQVAIIGAGPTAVSIADAAMKKGAQVTIFNRSHKKISYPLFSLDHLEKKLARFDICIQATSCGMNSDDVLPLEAAWFSKNVVALDVIGKEDTPFLQIVRLSGGKAISGVEMFERQAAKQFAFWLPILEEKRVLQAFQTQRVPPYVHMGRISLKGSILPPASKSHTMRSILYATFTHGTSHIINPLMSPDTEAMIAMCRQFGARITISTSSITVIGVGDKRKLAGHECDAANSGIVMRFGVAVSALFNERVHWTGDFSMQNQRPLQPLLNALHQLGVTVDCTNGYAPCSIQGPLIAKTCVVDGKDSQPVSALLSAAALTPGTTTIYVANAGEKPWIDLTLSWLKRLNVSVIRKEYASFEVTGRSSFEPFEYTVPVDWSSALYPIAIALMTDSDVWFHGLDFSDPQGDKKVLSILEDMGAKFEKDEEWKTLHVRGPQHLQNIDIDINDTIDAISLFAVIGTFARGTMRLYNGSNARQKECDRVKCSVEELQKLGAQIEEREDGLVVHTSTLKGAKVLCHEDHRMCLSLACAAAIADGITEIVDVSCIKKTYPGFFDMMQRLGRT